ncbi:hypothetical protein AAG906_040168 [Vitis piasezkii]
MAEERDPVELGMALGADSNMKEDSVTAEKRVKRPEIIAEASMEREKGMLDQDEDDLGVGERLGFSDQSNRAKERDLVELGMALGADSNMKEDKETSKKWRADSTLISSDSTMEENPAPPEVWVPETSPIFADTKMEIDISSYVTMEEYRVPPWVPELGVSGMPISADANMEIDRKRIFFGHHDLAKYIVRECPDLIKMKTPKKAEPSLLGIGNKEGNTVLHEALINRCKQEEVVEILIKVDPQVAYYPNKEGKSPLYLAAESHYFHVERMKNRDRKAVHGAIMGKNKARPPKDKDGRTPLHCAASIGYLEGVQMLLDQSNLDPYQTDSDGFCPIHVASMRGNVDIVKKLLQVSSDSIELLSKRGENILHVAAKYGKDNVVNFVLKEERLENFINEKDNGGNTPLHLATMHRHPKVVSSLTWDKRVDVNLVNDRGQTALDVVLSVKHPTTFDQALIWTALKSAGARPAGNSKFPPNRRCKQYSESPKMDKYKDRVNTLLLVSTLVATVTFAAGFTMPGGYNSSDPNVGMAALLMRNMFHMFVICNTTAMYTSILAAIILIWAQLGDLNLMDTALRFALPFLGLALTAMSLGFMAGVYLVVSNLHWLAIVVVIIGIICLVGLLVSFFLLFLPSKSTNRILRHISYYPFLILVWASKSPEMKRKISSPC